MGFYATLQREDLDHTDIVERANRVLARVDFPTFLTYCKTQTDQGTAPMEPWYHFFAEGFSGAGDPDQPRGSMTGTRAILAWPQRPHPASTRNRAREAETAQNRRSGRLSGPPVPHCRGIGGIRAAGGRGGRRRASSRDPRAPAARWAGAGRVGRRRRRPGAWGDPGRRA